jgi:hypothetical protein
MRVSLVAVILLAVDLSCNNHHHVHGFLLVHHRRAAVESSFSTKDSSFQRSTGHDGRRTTSQRRRMVANVPDSIVEQASTDKVLDQIIDESLRASSRRPIISKCGGRKTVMVDGVDHTSSSKNKNQHLHTFS